MAGDFYSIGRLAQMLGCMVPTITKAAATCGVSASLRIDDVPHFSSSDAERIRERIGTMNAGQPGRRNRQAPVEAEAN